MHGQGFAPVSTIFPDFATTVAGWTGTRVFYDDFETNVAEGSFLATYGTAGTRPSKWDLYPSNFFVTNQNPANGGNGNHYGGDTNVSVANGKCQQRLYYDAASGKSIGSCLEPILPGNTKYMTYGRIAVEIVVPQTAINWKPAWLWWPQTDDFGTKLWPAAGEFDWMEGQLTSTFGAFHHWYNAATGGDQDSWSSSTRFDTGTHIVVAEWTPNYVRTIVDGVQMGIRDASTLNGGTSRIVPNPMRLALQSEPEIGFTPTGTSLLQINQVAIHNYTGL